VKKILAFIICFWTAYAAANPTQDHLNKLVLRTKNPRAGHVNIGVMVKSLKTGQIIYEYQADHLFTPASTQKLFTATAGLSFLKPDFRFSTKVFTTGTIHNGELQGNLYLKFSGDPTLNTNDLKAMIAKLPSFGIHKITGRIYIDNSDYNWVPYPAGWLWKDLTFNYAAPMNAIILNENKFGLGIYPERPGTRPVLKPFLPTGVANFDNKLITTSHYNPGCPVSISSTQKNFYELRGCLPKRQGNQGRSLAIRDVVRYAEVLTKQYVNEAKLAYNEPVTLQVTPANAHLLFQHDSAPLHEVMMRMLKKSDNLYTNSILRKIGEQYNHRPSTWPNSLAALKAILAPSGINFHNVLINDGAGLSQYNLFSPRQFVQLLDFIYRNNTVRDPLIHALPIAGRDGTLRYRMPDLAKRESVRAKTGSMTGVSSLAGYIYTDHNDVLAFSIIVNNFSGSKAPYSYLENQICEFLVKNH
jgi:D-alanyl-D-alanine carboxypeptidase/D-alanyl-D-alanine-endopeptidase (penicillin-binding protein 4)